MSYDYSENILVQESAGNLLRDELGDRSSYRCHQYSWNWYPICGQYICSGSLSMAAAGILCRPWFSSDAACLSAGLQHFGRIWLEICDMLPIMYVLKPDIFRFFHRRG